MWFAIIAPILVAGLIANDRRLAWVELSVGVILLLVMNPRNWVTRRLIRTTVVLSPILVVYIGVGWFSASPVFGPVKTLRGVISPERSDGSIDRSTLFRDVENYNLIYTFTRSPFIGKGFGHAFDTAVANDDMSGFKEYPFLPHNSLLGLMGFAGGLGIMGLLAPLIVGLFLAARANGMAQTPEHRWRRRSSSGISVPSSCTCGETSASPSRPPFSLSARRWPSRLSAVSTGAWRLGRGAWGSHAMTHIAARSGASVEHLEERVMGDAGRGPEGDWQRLWFWLRTKNWSPLAVVPTDPGMDAFAVAETLVAVGHANGAPGLTLLNVRGVRMKDVQPVLETVESAKHRGGMVVVVCDAVDASAATLPIVRAASAVLLLVRFGESRLDSAKKSVDAIGRDRVLASITVSPKG